ncbi:hypothetical protein RB653_009598 [Dictyostelium firmibasis]|uniref:FAD-binding domain-containing protein n=1 Tax=Dictyostelium firmibasis TaxID=79012 RepID=A0AAN7TUC2_9MYCE
MEGEKIKVLIIGGGLGGLVLANILKSENISFKIYERDTSEKSRIQGYLIGLNKIGIEALKSSLSEEKFKIIQNLFKEGEFAVADRNLEILLKFKSGGTVNRSELRSILMEGIDVEFGKKLRSYVEDEENGEVTATFEDGTIEKGEILIGADGVRSTVRKFKLPDFKFADVNVFRIQALVPNVTKDIIDAIFNGDENSTILKTLGNFKNTIIFGRTKNIEHAISLGVEDVENIEQVIEENQHHSEILLISYEWRPKDSNDPIPTTRQDLLNIIRRDTTNYHPMVYKLINDIVKPEHLLDSKATPLTQASPVLNFKTSRVSLLGDSIHAMTSHAGMGGNTSMKDALELGNALKKIYINNFSIHESLSSYEKEMLCRGFKAVDFSRASTERMHANEVGWFGEKFRNTFMKLFYHLIVLGIVKLE